MSTDFGHTHSWEKSEKYMDGLGNDWYDMIKKQNGIKLTFCAK